MKRHIVFSVLILMVVTWTSFGTDYFYDDCETSNPLTMWTKSAGMSYTINELSLSTAHAVSGSKSIKLDITLNGGSYIYFKIPINVRFQPGQSYYGSANVYVDTFPVGASRKIGLGRNIKFWDGGQNTTGCWFFGEETVAAGEWINMESRELRYHSEAKAVSMGYPTDTIDIEYIYLGITGTYTNERIVVYIDDPKISQIPVNQETPIFYDDCEVVNPMAFWTKHPEMSYTVNELSLSPSRSVSSSKSIKLDVTLDGSSYLYFKIPVNIRICPDQSYYMSAKFYVETFPEGGARKIGLGRDFRYWYGPDRNLITSGCDFYDYVTANTGAWIHVESHELRREAEAKALSVGLPNDTIDIRNFYLGILGSFSNERVVVYIDDITVSAIPEYEEIPVDVDSYPAINNFFPFGLYGIVGGETTADASGVFGESFPEPLWRALPMWRANHINTLIGSEHVMADSSTAAFNNIGTLLDAFGKNNLKGMIRSYLTKFYRSDLTYAQCETTINTQIPNFTQYDSLLGWYLLDEPFDSVEALLDYLWGKEKFKYHDTAHPITTGGNAYSYLFARHRPVSINDWYPIRANLYAPWSVGGMVKMLVRDSSGSVWFIAQAFNNISGTFLRPSPEELKLMCYSALANGAKGLFFYNWRSRPCWYWGTEVALVDSFEVGGDLWEAVGDLGYHLSAVGPMLLSTSPVDLDVIDSNEPVYMVTPVTMETTWQEQVPVINVGLLADNSDTNVHYLIFYNNDPEQARSVNFQFNSTFTNGRSLFNLYQVQNLGVPGQVSIQLSAGEGCVYMLAPNNYFSGSEAQILAARFNHQKVVLKYKLYFPYLAGLVNASLLNQFKSATTTAQLDTVEAALNTAIAANQTYSQVGANLDAIQTKLSLINTLYIEKITSLQCLTGHPGYTEREYSPTNSTVADYLYRLQDIGHLYFAARNLYLRGTYADIADEVADLLSWANSLYASAVDSFDGGVVIPQTLDEEDIETMRTTLDTLLGNATPAYPDPSDLD